MEGISRTSYDSIVSQVGLSLSGRQAKLRRSLLVGLVRTVC
jgi:hypothetical protein